MVSDESLAGTDADQQTEDETQVAGEDDLPLEVNPLDTRIETGAIDPENALFVVLGMALTVMIVVRFISVLP